MKKFLSIVSIISLCLYPFNSVQGRIREKVMAWSSTTGHNHDGSIKGKVIDSSNVVNTPAGSISATDTQTAIDELDTEKIDISEKGAANGLATLDGSSKIIAIQLPAIAITDVNVCASQVCQLALIAEEGDVCIRSDENKSYVHNGGIVGDMTDWNILLSTGLVTSVNGETGDILNVERTTRIQTIISDSDSNYPSSGGVVDYVATHTSNASAHHTKTTSFGDLVDFATDAQIPNTITIDQATNADTVDSQHFTDIQADATSQISTHAGLTDVHHVKSHAHDGVDGSGTVAHSDSTGRTVDDHHDDLSNGYSITPSTVTTTGDIKINSDLTSSEVLFGITGDVNLYRGAANRLQTDDNIYINNNFFYSLRSVITEPVLATQISGDTFDRWYIRADGAQRWGSGTATQDTNFYRDSANKLKTDDSFSASEVYLSASEDIRLLSGGTENLIIADGTNNTLTNGVEIKGNLTVSADTITFGTTGDVSFSRETSSRITTPDQVSSDTGFRSTTTSATWFHATTTKYLSVSAASMQGYGTQPITVEYRWVTPSTADSADDMGQITLVLPNGVVISAMTAYGSTTASINSQVNVLMDRITLAGASSVNMADCTFNNSSTSCTDSTIGVETIDNFTYAYLIRVLIRAPTAITDTKLYNVRLTYTLSNVSQTL